MLVVLLVLLLLLPIQAAPAAQDEWDGVERVVVIGDVHGDFDQFVAILRLAGVIDRKGRWSAGKTHLVQLGDVVDRGAESRKAMDLLMKLEKQATQKNSRYHKFCFIKDNGKRRNIDGIFDLLETNTLTDEASSMTTSTT